MKIGIVGMSNLFLMPYLFTYTDFLKGKKIDFDVIYWNRKNLNEQFGFNMYSYNVEMKDSSHKVFKLKHLIGYTHFVKKTLKKNNYDFLIILTSLPAVLLNSFLTKKYVGKYLVDIRDYTYEHVNLYNKLFKKVLTNSALNVISSPGFIEFLPYKQAVLCHNLSFNKNGNRTIRSSQLRNKKPIRISYIGYIAYYDQCLYLINALANDNRFEFHFYGIGDYNSKIEKYCFDKSIKNVFIHGVYKPEEKEEIYGKTDIIFNAYGNDSYLLRYALSNKFYDSAWYSIPILVSPATSMQEYSKSLSFPVSYSAADLADQIYQWYQQIEWDKMENDAQTIINKAYNDNIEFFNTLNCLISKNLE